MTYCTSFDSPLGPLFLTSDGNALTGVWMNQQRIPNAEYLQQDELPLFKETHRWLEGYFLGNPPEISALPLSPAGTKFQLQVWEILRSIPYGETTSYGAIAKQLGPTMSAQAVGQAVGRNPISIIIPCHRVVGAKGQLTGYAGGLENKIWLLKHEEETK